MRTGSRHCLGTLAALTLLSGMVHATDAQTAITPMTAASKAQLARLCANCVLVTAQRSEERKGKASGLGAVGGAVLGGLLGNQVGGGTGKKIATVGGAVGGAMVGNELEKNRNAHKVWITTVQHKDGSSQVVESSSDPQLKVGDVALLDAQGHLSKQGAGQ
jgi:uncharacterized protein YcfJ